MSLKKFQSGRIFIGSLSYNKDFLESVIDFCNENSIKNGFVKSIGSFRNVTIGFFDQKSKEYSVLSYKEEFEICSAIGSISTYEDKPLIHLHVTLAKADGTIIGGHLLSPSIIFTGEIFIEEYIGNDLIREYDKQTGLLIWGN